MRSTVLAGGIAILLLAACQQAAPGATAEATASDAAGPILPPLAEGETPPGDPTPVRLGPEAVWNGTLEHCRREDDAVDTCLIDAMRANNAPAAAIAASQRLRGRGEVAHVAAWAERDGVGIATIRHPFRANTNQGTWLVDARGRATDVDSLAESALSVPSIETFRATHPDARLFAPAEFAGRQALPGGSVRFVYATPIRTCRACDTLGHLQVAYDFDGDREFAGQQVLGIE
ncbi:hypothetical protein CO641_14360 [Lysobacteraceae bacterium NML91-0213]|nr:hypothetical protein CO641_14360 [Xanthomonadaceae bacterium NML91-0213]